MISELEIDRLLGEDETAPAKGRAGFRRPGHAERSVRPKRVPLSTSTIARNGQIVPWLAAEGPLAYSPEAPPERDYYFQYNRILPGIFAEDTNLRRHYYFGAPLKDNARKVLSFWQMARDGAVGRVAHCLGTIEDATITAPLAVYRMASDWRGPGFVFIQHGSFQIVSVDDQPRLESGEVMLYRGVQRAKVFRLFRVGPLDAKKRAAWRRYIGIQANVLSDSSRSFNSIHDRAKRSETGHIRDRSWLTDDIARQHGLDIKDGGYDQALWVNTHQSFALARWVAENKFGPNYVVGKTPIGNIRLTTFFAGEHEVRIIDPGRLEILEEHGCRVEHHGY
jgi:hypothetical protein